MNIKRYETKIVITNLEAFNEFMFWMYSKTFFTEKFPSRQINSLYFDTQDLKSANENLVGLSNRRTLRLRWYESLLSLKLEEKIREDRVNSKKYYEIDRASIEAIHINEANALRKFMAIVDNCPELSHTYLIPTLFVNYNRRYLEEPNGIRLTIDTKIKFSDPRFTKNFLSGANTISYSPRIVEIKYPQDMKNYVSKLLGQSKFTPSRHSKYLVGLSNFQHVKYL